MDPEGSLPCLQLPTTCPYPEPEQSGPHPSSHFLKIHLNINAGIPWINLLLISSCMSIPIC